MTPAELMIEEAAAAAVQKGRNEDINTRHIKTARELREMKLLESVELKAEKNANSVLRGENTPTLAEIRE